MKAIRFSEFESSEVINVEEIEFPIPAHGKILVKICSSDIYPAYWKISGSIASADRHHMQLLVIPGRDTSEVVKEVGREVVGFKKEDAVCGVSNFPGDGHCAEYLAG